MFDYTLAHWSTFFAATILLNLSPGPDIAFILAQATRNGKRAGFAAMTGIWSGAFLHVFLAAAGLSAVLASSEVAFTLLKWIGAGYLIFLGLKALRPGAASYTSHTLIRRSSDWQIFTQGALVAATNPKMAIFFLAFLPQFVVPGAGPESAQLFLHGSLIIVVAVFIEAPVALFGARLSDYLRDKPHIANGMDRGLGVLFIGLGIRLGFSE